MARITKEQRRILCAIEAQEVQGMCFKYIWTFILGAAERVTATVRALESKSLVHISYYGGGSAAVNLTDKGRAEIQRCQQAA